MQKVVLVLMALILIVGIMGCNKKDTKANKSLNSVSPDEIETAIPTPPPVTTVDPESTVNPVSTIDPSSTAKSNEPKPVATIDKEAINGAQFGFADETGRHILANSELAKDKLAAITVAVGDGGQVLSVKYMHHQEGDEEGNGRDAAYNITHLRGELYEVIGEPAKPNETYYLTNSNSWSNEALIPVSQLSEEQRFDAVGWSLDQPKLDEFKLKKRNVKNGWALAHIGDAEQKQTLYLVEFERIGDDMLASIALQTEKDYAWYDMPAKYDPYSTWRVDDGGEISNSGFAILFAVKTVDGLVIGLQWMGAEGESVSFLSLKDGVLSELETHYGRYLAPI